MIPLSDDMVSTVIYGMMPYMRCEIKSDPTLSRRVRLVCQPCDMCLGKHAWKPAAAGLQFEDDFEYFLFKWRM